MRYNKAVPDAATQRMAVMTSKNHKAPKPDVMLSSTSRDLPTHRNIAVNAVLRAGMHPIIMEALPASLGDAIRDSLQLVDEAEIYIGIFGMRYGHIPDDPRNPERLSITEMEYRHAMKRGIPVLIFLMDDEHPGPKTAAEGKDFYETSEEGKQKLAALKKELMDKHVVGFFKSPEDLRGHIIHALTQPEVRQRAYEIAGIDPEPAPDKKSLPAPPEFYADPWYTLTTDFVGRRDELRKLEAWADSDDPMMIVEAIGGMGKSAVTWQWVREYALKQRNYDGVMWWSFYESGATMKAFVRHALAYITRQNPDDLKKNDLRENFKQLQRELNTGRYLLVLDGLERVLVAYHRWNAAQMRDDSVEDAEAIIKDRDIRACTDPKDDDILTGLLACRKTKVLLSSRLLPLALEDRMGVEKKGVQHIHLNGLHPDDALALVQYAKVRVDNVPQFQQFMKQFGYHSLLVKLVAGRVNKFRRGRGDFDAWYDLEGRHLTVADFDVKQSQTHVLQYALDGLDAAQMHFLSQVAAFGDALPYETLTIFNPFAQTAPEPPVRYSFLGTTTYNWEDETYLAEKAEYEKYQKSNEYRKALSQFDELLTELEERGLLRWDREKDTYDMHPVVRGYAFARLEGEAKTTTFERIRDYFEAQPGDDIENAQEVDDLANTIAIYRALLGAGKHDDAAEFFINRLNVKLGQNIAAYYTVIELLTPLFTEGTDQPPPLASTHRQSSITTTLASMYSYIGRTEEALALRGLTLKLNIDNDDLPNLIVGLLNYANSLRDDKQLALSQRVLETALALSEATENTNMIASSRLRMLGHYKDTGQWEEAEAVYAALQENPPREVFWQSVFERFYAEMLVQRGMDASTALGKAETLSLKGNNALGYRQIKGLRGEVALQQGDYLAAVRWFEEALSDARKHGSADASTFLGRLARTYALQDHRHKALSYIEEALAQPVNDEIHDMYCSVAEAYLALGMKTEATEYADKAYRVAWADGAPFSWWRALERAKKVLDALGEPYPAMPPYDPGKIGKYPYQDEVEAILEREQNKRRES